MYVLYTHNTHAHQCECTYMHKFNAHTHTHTHTQYTRTTHYTGIPAYNQLPRGAWWYILKHNLRSNLIYSKVICHWCPEKVSYYVCVCVGGWVCTFEKVFYYRQRICIHFEHSHFFTAQNKVRIFPYAVTSCFTKFFYWYFDSRVSGHWLSDFRDCFFGFF